MTKKILLTVILIIIISSEIMADTIYWANEIVGFSSQQSHKEYSANQILGSPSIMPYQGNNACAWMPKYPTDRIEWIRIKYKEKIFVNQILINENLNPGAIVKIILYDSLNRGYLVYSNNLVNNSNRDGRLLKINIDKPEFRSNELKIEVNTTNYIDFYQIDAVGIADYISNFDVKVNYIPDSVVYEKEDIGISVNSKYRELAPIISQDGRSLVFTREGHPDNIGTSKRQDVWISRIDSNGKFQEAINIGSPINNENANFAVSVSTDANNILLGNIYLLDGTTKVGFSKSKFNGKTWDFPEAISIKNYYNYYPTGSATLANNGKILITSVKRDDSFGKTDLYVSFLNTSDIWSEPVNLGSTINTPEEELSPFLASDNKTLYFSSFGFPGFGSNDMYLSKRLDDTWKNWSEPVNLGPAINTSSWDAYYTVTADGSYAYFVTSNLNTNEDIYRIQLPKVVKPDIVVLVKGKVLNKKTNQPVESKIRYEILPEGQEAGIASSNAMTGDYSIILPAGKLYGFMATAKDFISINENLDLKNTENYSEIYRDLYLVPIEKGQVVRINNIFFEFNEFILLPESFSELNRIVDLLNKNPQLKIQISGHTDNIGKDDFNKSLSLKRAHSVLNFLVENGIQESRLSTKGFGKSKPIDSNNTDEGRAKNRRVEFIIIDN